MPRLISILCSLTLFFSLAFSQSDKWSTMPRFKALKQEKVYLHFDKPSYVAGEQMWFRAYLVDAESHMQNAGSAALYVELISNCDSLIKRIKLPLVDSVFSGNFTLNETLPEGYYRVRAYTNWMRNVGPDYFYQRQFYVGNSITSRISSTVNYSFEDENTAYADIKLMQYNGPLVSKKLSYFINVSGKNKNVKELSSNAEGLVRITYNPKQIDVDKPFIHLRYEGNGSKYERDYVLPVNNDYDLQFFPEGGNLIHGKSNVLAFKAIQQNGFSTEISGTVFDNSNTKITEFKSKHLGMGKFYILPDSAKSYYAIIKNAAGIEKRVDLPAVTFNDIALSLAAKKAKLYVRVKSNHAVDSLFLLGHSRGLIFLNVPVKNIDQPIIISTSDIRPGIVSFVLVNKKAEVLSERLVFMKPKSEARIGFSFDKPNYAKREKVSCKLKLADAKGDPITGNFSLSVTDAADVQSDTTAANIVNTLLLSSDLKGYIEQPNVYFDPNFKQANEALDLLMLTQAWKRFDVAKSLKSEIEPAPHFLEKGSAITGRVKSGASGKSGDEYKVSLFSPKNAYFNSVSSDAKGRFEFGMYQFVDSTMFYVQAKRGKRFTDAYNILIDKDSFPSLSDNVTLPELAMKANDGQLEAANRKFIQDNGMWTVELNEVEFVERVEVEAPTVNETAFFDSYESFSMQGEKLEAYSNAPLSSLIKSLPGLQNWSENPASVESKMYNLIETEEQEYGPMFFWEDDMFSYKEVQGLNVGDLKAIKLMKSLNKAGSNSFSNYLIVLVFKENRTPYSSKRTVPTLVQVMPFGYAKPVAFYSPKYEVEAVRNDTRTDMRTLLFWSPKINVDADGNAQFEFYSSDKAVNYNIEIEGISQKGEPYRLQTQYLGK